MTPKLSSDGNTWYPNGLDVYYANAYNGSIYSVTTNTYNLTSTGTLIAYPGEDYMLWSSLGSSGVTLKIQYDLIFYTLQ